MRSANYAFTSGAITVDSFVRLKGRWFHRLSLALTLVSFPCRFFAYANCASAVFGVGGFLFFERFGRFGDGGALFTFLGADYARALLARALFFGLRLTKAGFTLAGGARATVIFS